MTKRTLIISIFVLSVAYLGILVRVPKVNFEKSTYVVRCAGIGHPLNRGWDYIPGEYLNFNYQTQSRTPILTYKSANAHVIAQFICAGIGELGKDSLPVDADAYAKNVLASPDFEKASSSVKVYDLRLGRAVYEPSWGNFWGKMFGLVVLVAISAILGKKFIKR